jgi:TonB family protein
MLQSKKLPNDEPLASPAKPMLTVIEKGKIVSVSGYRKLEVQPDKTLLVGLLSSLFIHVGLFAAGFYVWQAVAPSPAAGLDTSPVFNVELISASQFESTQIEQEQEVLPVEPEKQVIIPTNAKPVVEKPREKKKQVVKAQNVSSTTSSTNSSAQGLVGTSFGISTGSGKVPPNYAQIVAARISANKTYPRRAKERGVEGRVVVSLTVGRNGDLINSQVVSTDSSLLSNGVEEIIRRSTPFPAIPSEIDSSEVTLEVPIRFNLED